MTIEMLYHNRPEHHLVKVCGQWTEKDIKQAVDEIRTEADRRGFKHLLLDLRELHRPDSEMTRFWSGEYLTQVLPYPFKVAAFANPEDINKFGETAAVNRAAWYQIFSDEQTALRWLMDGPDKRPERTPQ
jgi:hypothetical protein